MSGGGITVAYSAAVLAMPPSFELGYNCNLGMDPGLIW